MKKLINCNKVCYFGHFDPEYSRNGILIKGLKENGLEVFLCNSSIKRSWKSSFELIKKLLSLKGDFDFLIVGYSDSRRDVLLAKLFNRGLVVWDAFYSLYDSWIWDRQLASPGSLKAFCYWFLDWLNCRLSDRILLDTEEHIKYFIKEFKVDRAKFIKVLVGTDDDIFKPKEKQDKAFFTIGFWGKFIPLHGVEFIVKAAKILENQTEIKFKLIGSGQEFSKVKQLADDLKLINIDFLPKVEYHKLPDLISNFDVCLGIFGKTNKARRVIPNKVYEAIACCRPVITSETPAMRELFVDGQSILFCRRCDAEDLATKILILKNNSIFSELISNEGNKIYLKTTTPIIIVRDFLNNLKI